MGFTGRSRPNVDQVLASEEVTSTSAAGDVLWALTDHLGTVRDLVDYDAGTDTTTVQNHLAYDAFGQIISETNAAVDFLFGFTGREGDEESDLQYNRARYYSADVGLWLNQDPLGFAAGDENLYRYVSNRPSGVTDPSGLEGFTWGQWGTIGLEGLYGAGDGLVNIGTTVAGGIYELGAGAYDIGGAAIEGTTATSDYLFGTDIYTRVESQSSLGQAWEPHNGLGLGDYGVHAARTGGAAVTLGISEQAIAGYEYYNGDITADEASGRIGAVAVGQGLGAKMLPKGSQHFYNRPIQELPSIARSNINRAIQRNRSYSPNETSTSRGSDPSWADVGSEFDGVPIRDPGTLPPTRGSVAEANFAQVRPKSGGKEFSKQGQKFYSDAAGRPIKTIDDLADALKLGEMDPSQAPVDYVIINGKKQVANTRTSEALRKAEIPQSEWYGRNRTGQTAYGDTTFDDLVRNQMERNNCYPDGLSH